MEEIRNAPYRKLISELHNHLSLQVHNPDKVIATRLEVPGKEFAEVIRDRELLKTQLGSITNCMFNKNGKELFNDGRRHLIVQFMTHPKMEEYEKFKDLEFYPEFIETPNGTPLHTLSIDCGDNAKRAAEIYITVMAHVFGIRFSPGETFVTDVESSKKVDGFMTFLTSERHSPFKKYGNFSILGCLLSVLFLLLILAALIGIKTLLD